jgi:type II secretory pathway component PulK
VRSRRAGVALIAVLWVIVGAGVIATAASLAAREAVAGARNRTALMRAQWRAEECLERVRATLADSLASGAHDPAAAGHVWRSLDQVIATTPLPPDAACRVGARAAGTALDVNMADGAMLRSLFMALGEGADRADSLADALLDWRDGDEFPRPRGAERGWYLAQGRFPPRDGPFADARELERVRGLGAADAPDTRDAPNAGRRLGLGTLLGVEPGRIPLGRAPLAVLAALPGMTRESVARVADLRAREVEIVDLVAFAGLLSPAAREALLASYSELVQLTTAEPDAWIVEAAGFDGEPRLGFVVEVRLVRAGARPAIVRRRTWIAGADDEATAVIWSGAP